MNPAVSHVRPIVPVLLAGGSGTRLWPLSREQHPKQFLSLPGARSLLQETVLRLHGIEDALPPLTICPERYRFIAAEQLQAIGVDAPAIMLEPEARNTLPAIAVAASHVAAIHGPQTLLLLLPVDHVIRDAEKFRHAIQQAVPVAESGLIVCFGVKPTRAETGFGYLHAEAVLSGGARSVAAFIEKPDEARAQGLLAAGDWYWNSGVLLVQAATLLAELRQYEPDSCASAAASLRDARRDLDFMRLDAAHYGKTRAVSIDHALLERTDKAAMLVLDAGWDEISSWRFLDTLRKDDHGNGVHGDVWLEASRNNFAYATSRLVVLTGVDDLVVVETDDAVLVTRRERSEDLRHLVARLNAAARPEAQQHRRVLRPWGSYETIASGERFQVKRLIVRRGGKLSLQKHHHRAEHWVVVRGTARVSCGEQVFLLGENQSTYIPLGEKHRLENPGSMPLELIEVQSGAYLGEDDIVRFDDVYGRS